MAKLLLGKVFYNEIFAGYLREDAGDCYLFQYDSNYLNTEHPPIAHTLPLQEEAFISQSKLHPFFDNLVAEGWLEKTQTRLLQKRQASRFELLLTFGQDCIGAISVVDPEPSSFNKALIDKDDFKESAVMVGRASLSGVQPKLAVIEENGKYRPAKIGEVSTYIAKFPSPNRDHDDLVINEYLTTLACKALIPEQEIVELKIGQIEGIPEDALIIKRFDRMTESSKIHFEEFNQLFGRLSVNKYDGSYKEMAEFIHKTPRCLPVEVYRLYQRIIVGLFMGNTDMHLKNFAMFHTPNGFRLTPIYDQVAASLYTHPGIALDLYGSTKDMYLSKLKAKHIIKLGEEFGLEKPAIKMAYDQLVNNIEAAKEIILKAELGTEDLKNKFIKMMEKRWEETYSLIGQSL